MYINNNEFNDQFALDGTGARRVTKVSFKKGSDSGRSNQSEGCISKNTGF